MPDLTMLMDIPTITVLLGGFLGYWVASGGYRTNYNAFHAITGVLFFILVTNIVRQFFLTCFSELPSYISCFVAAGFAIICAILWRKCLSKWSYNCLNKWGIITEQFGPPGAWDYFFKTPPPLRFTTVYLKDGSALESDKHKLKCIESDYSKVTTDPEGNIVFIATGEYSEDSKGWISKKFEDEKGRMIFTYIPASNIAKIETYVDLNS